MVGDEESAREMCKDTEDSSSCGMIAETLNIIDKDSQMGKGGKNATRLIGWVSEVLGR